MEKEFELKGKVSEYCYRGNDGAMHCHVFEDGIYSHFETEGIVQKDSVMTAKWKEENLTEEAAQKFLKEAGFELFTAPNI